MQTGFYRIALAVALLGVSLSACGNREKAPPDLMIFPRTAGPDEFAVIPAKPLAAPEDYTALPEPTPGGADRTDPTPDADAVAALGGRPAALGRDNATPRTDGGLLSHAARFGVAPDIRQALAAEDLAFRHRNRGLLLERVFNVNVYFDSYAGQSLDQYAELRRLRRLGVRTPAAPPDPAAR